MKKRKVRRPMRASGRFQPLKFMLFAVGIFTLTTNVSASSDNGDGTFSNPLIYADVPDLDVIRVDDAFYMVSTTMHIAPGVPIMKSYDLVNWKIVNYAYDQLETTDPFALKNGQNDYASGSWASSLRYDKYEGRFYVTFSCQSTGKSYIYSTTDIENGPWHKNVVAKCYDAGLLFEDTGTECKKHIIYASDDLSNHIVSIRDITVDANHDVTLSNPTVIIPYGNLENPAQGLRAEGVHTYKIGDYYYVFMIQGSGWQRQEICWRSKSLEPGTFEGKLIFAGNIIGANGKDVKPYTGIAQGGVVQTKEGKWYAPLFEDYGAVGRIPVLLPVQWVDNWPVLGNNGTSVNEIMDKPVQGYEKLDLVLSDEFNNGTTRRIFSDKDINTGITAGITVENLQTLISQLNSSALATKVATNEYGYNGSNLNVIWQWNHNPNNNLWSLTDRAGYFRLKSGIIAPNIQYARNNLTQRTFGPVSSANVAIEVANMKDGDVAGLSAFQNQYGFVGVKMNNGKKWIVMQRAQKKDDAAGLVMDSLLLTQDRLYLKVDCDFRDKGSIQHTDKANFYYSLDSINWVRLGDQLQMSYDWPHFVGYRFGLFYYSTKKLGGYVDFDYFHVEKEIAPVIIKKNPYSTNEAESADEQSGIQTESCSDTGGGLDVGYIDNGDWLQFTSLDFGSGASSFEARVASATSGGDIEIRLDSLTGKLVGTCAAPGTSGWQNWITKTCNVTDVDGVHDLFLKFTGGGFNINWWKFNAVAASVSNSKPESPLWVVSLNGCNYLKGIQVGDIVTIYNCLGAKVSGFKAATNQEQIKSDLHGVFIIEVKSGEQRSVVKTIL